MAVAPPGEDSSFRFAAAVSTLGCPELEFAEAASLVRASGVRLLELRALGGTTALPEYFAARFGTPAELEAAAEASGVAFASVGTSLRLIGGTEADRQAFLAYVPWALALRAPSLRVFDGGTYADDAELDQAEQAFAWWDRIRDGNGLPIDIVIETHDALAAPLSLQRFVDRFPGRKLLWDTHHTWRRGGEAPARTWSRLRHATAHIHVKDSVTRDASPGYGYVALGTGEFPLAELLQILRADRFAGPVSLEWERLWHPELAPLADVLPGFASLMAGRSRE